MTPALALQKAVYARLCAEPALRAELGDPPRIYDDPPADAVFPYLALGEAKERPLPGLEAAREHDLRLYAFSRYAGRREVKTIIGAVYDALQDAPLALEGCDLVSLRFVFADAFRRTDGETYQAVARFRAVTQPLQE